MGLTDKLLQEAMGCTPERAALWAPHLAKACRQFNITTPARLAAFIAQIGHESGSLRWVREVWGPTAAQERYEGRKDLGNVQPGDGKRYMGRGPIQLTGRANYAWLRDYLRSVAPDLAAPDFEADPELVAQPEWGAMAAGAFWFSRSLNALAEEGSFDAITKRINGGFNGKADRDARYERAKAVLATAPETEAVAPSIAPKEEEPMVAPFVMAALPALLDAVPKLGKLFGSGSEVSERNQKAVELAVNVAKESINARNEQELVEKLNARDPETLKTVRDAVEGVWLQLQEVGGGIEAARAADRALMTSDEPWYAILKSPSFLVALLLLPLVYMVMYSVLFATGDMWNKEVRSAIAQSVVSLILGALIGYYYGQMTSRNKKD